MTVRFQHIQLRTTEPHAAREFHAGLLGADVAVDIVELPAAAIARGAVPHWLGQLGVDDLAQAVATFVDYGAIRLGPPPRHADEPAILRDGGGAVVSLAPRRPLAPGPEVAWHLLNTQALERMRACYVDVCGWSFGPSIDRGELGTFEPFAWDGPAIGALASIVDRPAVHPHWLFFLRVRALDGALAWVRAQGGLVLGRFEADDGRRVAVCEDPQGATFGLAVR
jgi:hypothetical protein